MGALPKLLVQRTGQVVRLRDRLTPLLGLPPAAWVIILTASATYIALLSSFLMALPAQRAALLQGNIIAIEAEFSDDPLMQSMQQQLIKNLKQRAAASASRDKGRIRLGTVLLAVSVLVFTGAVYLQATTDAAFRPS